MTETSPTHKDIPLDRLRDVERMSVRAYHVCSNNGLESLDAILHHYHAYGSFLKLRNAGRLTEQELISICRKYLEGDSGARLQEIERRGLQVDVNVFSPDWGLWSPSELARVNRELAKRSAELSPLTRDWLRFIVPRIDEDIQTFDTYVTSRRERLGFNGDDRLTLQELLILRAELIRFAGQSSVHHREEESFRRFAALWSERFGYGQEELFGYRQAFMARRFPLFRFLNELLVARGKGIAAGIMSVMRGRYRFLLGDEKRPMDEIGQELGVTRERVRQIAMTIPGRLHDFILELGPISEYLCYEPLQCWDRDVVIIDDEFAQYVNAREGVSFTSSFYAVIFEAFLKENFDRVEEDFDAATDYLIRDELTRFFDFDAYLRRISERLEERIPQRYVLDLSEEVEAHFTSENRAPIRRICAVCELLAHEEFGLAADSGGNLILERNTKKRMDELIADLLLDHEKPMHVQAISAALNERFPDLETTMESVRNTVLRYPDRFARLDTGSVYGLKEWEHQNEGFKSGTFADIAQQFLEESSTPCHFSEVAEYVMRYRTTTEVAVVGTLKVDSVERFVFYDGGMIGLAAKEYGEIDTNYRAVHPRVLDNICRIVRDLNSPISLVRLIDYCVLHYRMPEQQAKALLDRLVQLGRMKLEADGVVRIVEEARVEVPTREDLSVSLEEADAG